MSHEVARQNMSGMGGGNKPEEDANLTASIVVEMVRPVYSLSQNSLNHSSLEFTGVQNTTNEQCKYTFHLKIGLNNFKLWTFSFYLESLL